MAAETRPVKPIPAQKSPAASPTAEVKARRVLSSGLRLIVDDEPVAERHLGLPIAIGVAVVAVMGCLYGLNSASQAKAARRADGKLIEVPRVFSYSGAVLKKPFWLYDKKMSEAKMEIEAQKEKQARDAWRVLHDEAERQENAASRKSNGQVERVDKRTCDLVEYAAKTIAI